ncbi:hypothetical protein C6P40_004704 [Pichia californica]|uniref:Uncharacterized protein n=1 Tax=Pichia californica TaxID=460514 RepID=A0A9P7BER1_9ASCO|nr:hypothetical protein C6P40_004704 [[Candida] californica]
MSKFLDLNKTKDYSPTLVFRQQQQQQQQQQEALSNNPTTTQPLAENNGSSLHTVLNQLPDINTNNIGSNKGVLPFIQRTNLPSIHNITTTETQLPETTNQPIVPNKESNSQHEMIENHQKLPDSNISNIPLHMSSNLTIPTSINNVSTISKPGVISNNILPSTPGSTSVSLGSQNYLNKLKSDLENNKNNDDDQTLYGSIPNTISMASIPLPAIKSSSLASKSLGFINLTSDDESDEDISFDAVSGLKNAPLTNKNEKLPILNSSSTSATKKSPEVSLNNLLTSNSIPNYSSSIGITPSNLNSSVKREPSFTTSSQKTPITLDKFSYKDKDDKSESDDEEDDDDIIITGVSSHPNVSNNVDTTNILSAVLNGGGIKRENQFDNDELARKRQEILKNKQEQVWNNIKKEENIQQSIHSKAELEKKKIEKERIDKLLANYPHIKALPSKYQIKFPEKIVQFEPVPILPDSISPNEVRQDVSANTPHDFRATKFRQENLDAMYSVIFRYNKLNDLHNRLDRFLKDAVNMRAIVQEKATKTAGLKKADIRYNQILRFLDEKIKSLSFFYGSIGRETLLMKKYKLDLISRSALMEKIRNIFILQRNIVETVPRIDMFRKVLPQLNLVVNTVTVMCKLTGLTSNEALQIVRGFGLTPKNVPKIQIPDIPESKLKTEYTNDPLMNMIHETFDNMNSLSNNEPNFMPFSNVYGDNMGRLNPYGDLRETEGIKNLMESIKVTEFKEEGLANTPEDMCISLLKHQRIGLSWMLKNEEGTNKGGILADDMGLGKTIQAISLMIANKSKDNKQKTNIIIGPVSLLNQWQQEIAMKLKDDKQISTYLFHSSNKVKTFAELAQFDVILISYQTLGSEWKKHYAKELAEMKKNIPRKKITEYKSPFFSQESIFYRIILDEAQYIKNKNTIASKAVASLTSKYRWCLSGTPIQNKIEELYPLIRFLGIPPYNDWDKFNRQIVQSIKDRSPSGNRKIHAVLSALLLRRTKDSEIDGKPILTLPEKHIIEERINMDQEEKEFYSSLELLSARAADKLMNSKVKAYSSILTLLLRMRQATDHEYLVRLGDDGDRVSRLERFQKGYKALMDYSKQVDERILNEIQTGFQCMHCYEELADSQTLLLSKCGHPVCYECHDEYFEEHLETNLDEDMTCKCSKCGIINLASMSVDLRLFEAYHKGMTWQEIRRNFDLDSKASDKAWRLKTIKKFIEEDGKLKVSAKVTKTIELIQDIIVNKPGEKVIVFSQFIGYFDIMKLSLTNENIDFLQYDGSMDIHTKNDCINAFYKDPSKRLLLLSLKAGNVGLTLTCANHVIIAEPFWNPYVEKQAQDRVHRISQTKEVYVHRLLISGTIEDRIMELQKEKEELVETALDPSARSKIGKLSRRELGFLFGLNGLAQLEDE